MSYGAGGVVGACGANGGVSESGGEEGGENAGEGVVGGTVGGVVGGVVDVCRSFVVLVGLSCDF